MKKPLATVIVLIVVAGLFPFSKASASLSAGAVWSFCSDTRLIYAQDIPGVTPGPDSDTAIINDRNGNRLATYSQISDHYVIFNATSFVQVQAGDTLHYEGADQPDRNVFASLPFDYVDTNGNIIQSLVLTQSTSLSVPENGALRFNAGDIAWEQNFLVLCPGAPPSPPPAQNFPPVWAPISSQSTLVGQTLQFSVFATDPENHPITYSATQLPSGAQFNPVTRIFTWTPISGQAGTHVAVFQATDGVHSVPLSVSISVVGAPPANLPPVWSFIPSQSISVNQTLQFSVFASDPEGQALTYSAIQLPSGASFNPGTRVFTWTPASNQAGTHTVTFSVTDGSHSVSLSVSITVSQLTQTNQPPTWSTIGSQTVLVNQMLQFSVFASDPEGHSIAYGVFNLPSGAQFDPQTRLFSWTPSSSQQGTYTLTFTASDGVTSASMNVSIAVSGNQNPPPSNQPPQWSFLPTQYANVGQTLQFSVFAYDPEGHQISYSAFNLPPGADFNAFTRVFTWTPSSYQTGNYTATFRASDGVATSDMNVSINLSGNYNPNLYPYGGNRPPVWYPTPTQTVVQGQTIQFSVSAYDPDNNYLTYSATQLPPGSSFNTLNNSFSWTPSSAQLGTQTIIFRVSDGSTSTDMYVTITVTQGSNQYSGQFPVFVNFNPPLYTVEGQLYSYLARAVSNGRPITYRVITGPAGFAINSGTGLITWVPGSDQGRSAAYPITIGASDSYNEATQNYNLYVQNSGGVVSGVSITRPAAPVSSLVISDLAVNVQDNGDVIVTWDTNKPATSRVIYGTFSQVDRQGDYRYEYATNETLEKSANHRFNLNSLKPGQKYYLRAVAKADGEVKVSEERIADLVSTAGLGIAFASFGDLFKNGWFFILLILILLIGWLVGRAYRRPYRDWDVSRAPTGER